MSARLIVSTVFALAMLAGAAWAGPATSHSATKTHAAKVEATPRIELNTATREELMKLPGVDEATVDKIVAARPFKSRGELRSKNIVSATEYARLRDKVSAKSTTVAASSH